jgi:Mg-chelatase subunit ChlD
MSVIATALIGCGQKSVTKAPGTLHSIGIALHMSHSHPGTAVVILVDTSGSMEQPVRTAEGKNQPKYQIAHQALDRIIEQTSDWKKKHADQNLQLGIYHFASSVSQVLAMGDFDAEKAQKAVARIPRPHGGTAIGKALQEGFRALDKSGCTRMFVVCITDGENTVNPPPDKVARKLYAQTGGKVELHFVAFDTSATQFRFLQDVNGHVVEARDGGQLQQELQKIYEKRILAEALEEPQK